MMLSAKEFGMKSFRVENTNIRVQKLTPDFPIGTGMGGTNGDRSNRAMTVMCSVAADPLDESQWFDRTFRPAKNLVHPAEAFLHGIKRLCPAIHFNTFNAAAAKGRRVAKQQQDQSSAKVRRKAFVAPTAAMKAAINPKKLPAGSHATDAESRFMSRGKENKKQDARAAKKREEKRRNNEMGARGGDVENPKPLKKKRRREEKVGDAL